MTGEWRMRAQQLARILEVPTSQLGEFVSLLEAIACCDGTTVIQGHAPPDAPSGEEEVHQIDIPPELAVVRGSTLDATVVTAAKTSPEAALAAGRFLATRPIVDLAQRLRSYRNSDYPLHPEFEGVDIGWLVNGVLAAERSENRGQNLVAFLTVAGQQVGADGLDDNIEEVIRPRANATQWEEDEIEAQRATAVALREAITRWWEAKYIRQDGSTSLGVTLGPFSAWHTLARQEFAEGGGEAIGIAGSAPPVAVRFGVPLGRPQLGPRGFGAAKLSGLGSRILHGPMRPALPAAAPAPRIAYQPPTRAGAPAFIPVAFKALSAL